MSSHIHLVARRKQGLMSDFIRDFKSHTAKEIILYVSEDIGESRKEWLLHMFRYHAKYQKQNKEFQVWQKTSHPIEPGLCNRSILKFKKNILLHNDEKLHKQEVFVRVNRAADRPDKAKLSFAIRANYA
jgi:putative transposase